MTASSSALLEQLRTFLGAAHVLTGDAVRTRSAGVWQTDSLHAKAIVRPRTTEEVSTIMHLCHASRQSVVIHGGLTGLVHGAHTTSQDIILSLERMTEIESLDETDRTLTAQSGAILQNLQEAASHANLFLPLDLGARGSCTIGGNLATNAGGNKVIRHGMTRNLVLGLEAVLADGTIISSMNRMLKNNAGYDLKQLFIGSEGTLGVITRVILRLQEKPCNLSTALVAIDRFEKLCKFLRQIDAASNSGLHAFEAMWQSFYALSANHTAPHNNLPLPDHYPFYALIEITNQGHDNDIHHFQNSLAQAFENGLLCDAVIAKSETERTSLWAIRDNVGLLQQFKPLQTFDISLSLSDMPAYIQHIETELACIHPAANCFIFGHLGDGNLHIVIAPGTDDATTRQEIETLIYDPLASLHGSVSAEHGIGLEKKPYLSWCRSATEINLMRQLKKTLDPHNILNPGKIFDSQPDNNHKPIRS